MSISASLWPYLLNQQHIERACHNPDRDSKERPATGESGEFSQAFTFAISASFYGSTESMSQFPLFGRAKGGRCSGVFQAGWGRLRNCVVKFDIETKTVPPMAKALYPSDVDEAGKRLD